MRKLFACFNLLACTLTLLTQAPANAISVQGIGLKPVVTTPDPTPQQKAYFFYNVAPNTTQHSSFTLANYTTTSHTIMLSAVDATTTSDGTFAMLNNTGSLTGAGAWIHLPYTKITIPARTKQTIPFTFSVPSNASVGDHLGGIVAQDMNQVARPISAQQSNVRVITRVGLRVYVSVQGKSLQKIDIASFKNTRSHNQVTFWTALRNAGNTISAPSSSITLKEWGNKLINMSTAQGITLAPDSWYKGKATTNIHTLLVGYYLASLKVQDQNGNPITRSTSFLVINWTNLILLIAIISYIAFRVRRIKNFKQLNLKRLIFGSK